MIRIATVADAQWIAQLERSGAHHPWSLQSVVSQLTVPSSRALAIPELAHILTSIAGDEAEVLTVVVHPDARRLGHAGALLDAAKRAWEQEGVTQAFLEVRANNHGARALYEGRGWEIAGRRPDYYGPEEHALIYALRLNSDGRSRSS